MQIQIESTGTVTEVNGVACRHWKGTTARGIPCDVFVAIIATNTSDDSEFETELFETSEPTEFRPLNKVLE